MIKSLIIASIILFAPLQAEDNPFATKPRYGHDPFFRESLIPYRKKF